MTDAALLTAVESALPNLDTFTRSLYVLARWRLTQGKPLTPAQRTHLARLVPAQQLHGAVRRGNENERGGA